MEKYNIYALGIFSAVVSFIGFIVENVWLAITKGYINNRNMIFPFLLGYGVYAVLLYLLVGTPNDMVLARKIPVKLSKMRRFVLYFLIAMVTVSLGEILLGTVVEKMAGIYYWDYTNLPLHITRYTSVPTSFLFGLLITSFMGFCFYPTMDCINKMNPKWMKAISIVLFVMMLWDFIACGIHMAMKKSFRSKWKILLRV